MQRRPSNWYEMGYEEQRAWERQEREREDLEYERDQAKEQAEREFVAAREAKERLRNQHAIEVDEYVQEIGDLRHEIGLRDQWLQEKGLSAEFDEWASYRRSS